MEVQDGLIVGIFNYCDRWCERCPLTSRCGLFAEAARHEAENDSSFKDVIAAAPHAQDVREPPPWLVELIDEINAASEEAIRTMAPTTTAALEARLPEPYGVISKRAKEYGFRAYDLWRDSGADAALAITEPWSVIRHFATLIAAKVYRALSGLAEFDGDREFPPDHEGSAKVVLVGIEQSLSAWRELATSGRVNDAVAADLICELEWLRSEIEAAIPRACEFVRPGFDEPDEVRRLDASGV